MAASIVLPFVPAITIAAVVVGVVVLVRLLPLGWSTAKVWLVAVAGSVGISGLLVVLGILPGSGGLLLTAHALCMALGFVLGWLVVRPRAAAVGVSSDQLRQVFAVALVLGLVGARARYVWERWDRFALDAQGQPVPLGQALAKAADLDAGGAVWYGGLTFGALGVMFLLWRWRIRFAAFGDAIAPAILVGLGMGRIGCFFNGCCYGAPTGLPWAVACPVPPHGPVHPAQLYETIATWTLAALLVWWHPRRRHDGQVLVLAMIGYGLWRFANEGLRGGHDAFTSTFGVTMTTSQASSLHLVLGAVVVGLVLRWRRQSAGPAATVRDPQSPA